MQQFLLLEEQGKNPFHSHEIIYSEQFSELFLGLSAFLTAGTWDHKNLWLLPLFEEAREGFGGGICEGFVYFFEALQGFRWKF